MYQNLIPVLVRSKAISIISLSFTSRRQLTSRHFSFSILFPQQFPSWYWSFFYRLCFSGYSRIQQWYRKASISHIYINQKDRRKCLKCKFFLNDKQLLGNGVTVARLALNQLVQVQILVPQFTFVTTLLSLLMCRWLFREGIIPHHACIPCWRRNSVGVSNYGNWFRNVSTKRGRELAWRSIRYVIPWSEWPYFGIYCWSHLAHSIIKTESWRAKIIVEPNKRRLFRKAPL